MRVVASILHLLVGAMLVGAPAAMAQENGNVKSAALNELGSWLTAEAKAQLGRECSTLAPDGHELAELFLKPLTAPGGPVEGSVSDAAEAAYKREKGQLPALLAHRVSLLGGYAPQELGDPINWFVAPKEDWQWPTHLSRHYWLKPLVHAWQATHDPTYSRAAVGVLLDWTRRTGLGSEGLQWYRPVSAGPEYPATAEGSFVGYCDGPWTSLSAHARVDTWSYLFAFLWDAPEMTNDTVATFLVSLARDHRLEMINHPRAGTGNQFLSLGVSLVHLNWWYPGLAGSAEAERIGWERIATFGSSQVYPDGSMAECSPNYAAGSLQRLIAMVEGGRARQTVVPAILEERIRLAGTYFATIADPHGKAPRIAKGKESLRGIAGAVNALHADPELAWFASEGKTGTPPTALAAVFPWAGHVVFRSGWDEDATWLFFEPGPRGSGHHDLACLGIQLQSRGAWLLTDPGYFTYSSVGEDGDMSRYLHSSAAHNVALVDGLGQRTRAEGQRSAPNEQPTDCQFADDGTVATAAGTYAIGFGPKGECKVRHSRRIVYYRAEDRFEIEDRFEGEGRHRIALHWQPAPTGEVQLGDTGFTIRNGSASASLATTADTPLTVAATKGQRDPLLGWYSETYGKLEPNTTIRIQTEADLPLVIRTQIQVKPIAKP